MTKKRFTVTVYPENCKECGYCVEVCKFGVLVPTKNFNKKGYRTVAVQNAEKCVGCRQCFFVCPDYAIDVEEVTGKAGGSV